MSRPVAVKSRTSRVRLADVAQLAGVSTTTASRALNGRGELSEETRAAVVAVANRLGFRPSPFAKSLRSSRSHTIGLIIPHVAHPFYASIVQGAQQQLRERGYRLVVIDAGEDPRGVGDAIETLFDNWADGILISTAPLTADEFSASLHGTPCVFIDEIVHISWVDLPGMAHYRQELAFYALDRRLTLTLPSPYLRNMPSLLTIDGGIPGTAHSWRTVETVSYEEAFKRELFELEASIREKRPPRTDVIDGLHDVVLCHAIARSQINNGPVSLPSQLPEWSVQN